MTNIVRAWKDEAYRLSLCVEDQAMLPVNPAGEIELTDAELRIVYGASSLEGDSTKENANVDQHVMAVASWSYIPDHFSCSCSAAFSVTSYISQY